MSGLDHSAGNLQVMKAPEMIPFASDNPLSGDVAEGFITLRDYVTPNGDTVLVGKRGGSLWVGTQRSWRRKLLSNMDWEFDMLDSNEISSGYGINLPIGENHGTAPYKLNRNGNVRFFDGNSFIETNAADASSCVGIMCFSVWVKPDHSVLASGVGVNIVLIRDTGLQIFLALLSGRVYAYISGKNSSGTAVTYNTYATAASTLTSAWHLVQITWTNGQYPVLYVDGEAVAVVNTGTLDILAGVSVNATTKLGKADYYGGFLGLMGTASCYTTLVPDGFLDQYAHELPRYQDAETPITWKPLLGRAYSGSDSVYLDLRTYLGEPEQFQQVGNNLYCTPMHVASEDYPIRWSGFFYDAGRAQSTSTTVTLTIPSQDKAYGWYITITPQNAGIRAGDTIYFATWNTTLSRWVWDLKNGRVIKSVYYESFTLETGYDTTGKGHADGIYYATQLPYVIVRTHRVGMPEMPDLTAASSATTGTLPAGKYEYVAEYGSDMTGYSGLVAISNIVTLSAAASIQVSGWSTTVPEKDVDWLKIYRSYDDNSGSGFDTPKLVNKIARADIYTALTLPANWTDTGVTADSGNPLGSDSDLRSRPGAISNLIYFNDRLYGFDGADLVASTLGYYEYFPTEQWSATSSSTINTNIGLRVPIGSGTHDPIVAIVPEDGAYETTGIKGSDLLLLLRNRAVRWFGVNLDDFDREPAFAEGGISQDFAMNAGGMIVFGSDHHVFVMASGSNAPNAVEGRRWSHGLPVGADTLKRWKCAYWNGWYLFLGTETEGSDPDTFYMFNVAKGTWTSVPGNYLDIFVPSNDPTRNVLVSDANGNVYDLFASATAQSIEYKTGRLSLESSADEIVDVKHMRLVRMFVRPATASDVDLTITTLGDNASSTSSKTVTVPKGTDRVLIKVEVPMDAVNPALKITSDTAVWPFQIDMCNVECADPHGDGTGVK
ncbi:MAG: hypothetical protein ABFD83_13890 [Armatimonadota bacterium]